MEALKRLLLMIIIIMFQLIALAVINLSIYYSKIDAFSTGTLIKYILPINIFLIFLAITSVVVINHSFQSLEKNIENQLHLENMNHLEDLLRTMRMQRHDFNHHLQTVYGFLAVGAYEEGKSYLEEIFSEITLTNEIIRIDNPGIRALLHVKCTQMEYHNIKFEIDIKTSLEKLPIKISEINIVLGNLLNNAMEALGDSSQETPFIGLNIDQRENAYMISVVNNGPPINAIEKEKIFEPGYSKKKGNQGMGLYAVIKTVENYQGKINVISDENTTIFEISFPL